MVKKIIILLTICLCFSQELKVEGNLTVTGAVINDSLVQVIDSLKVEVDSLKILHIEQQSLIEQLQAQIILLGQQLGLADCNSDFGGDAVLDECGVCDNDTSNDCLQDCAGVWGGNAFINECGVCDGGNAFCITDYDGNSYETIIIGEQEWMAENLKTTHYNNGDVIPNITNNEDWVNLTTGAYGDYDNNPSNSETYGRLYNWYTVDDSRGVCPVDWHVPSDEEYKTLEMYLGMSQSEADGTGWRGTNEGSKLAGNASLWSNGSLESNAEFGTSGFAGVPSGYRDNANGGSYYDIGLYGYFWSSTEGNSTSAWRRYLTYSNAGVYRINYGKRYGFSVRCVR